jgi:hypothetical protein
MNLAEFMIKLPIIFKEVKGDVMNVLGQHRAGLRLGLADMGMYRGNIIIGLHFHPGTDIIMNTSLIKIITSSLSDEIVWAYAYHILLKLYLKSLGVVDEYQCNKLTLQVSMKIFKKLDHPAVILAENGIGYFIPNLKISYTHPDIRRDEMLIEYLIDADEESQSYFS